VRGAHRPRVWRYLFTHRHENDAFLNTWRAFHSAELAFVSGNLQTLSTGTLYSPSSAETALANEMMDYWARFAATGDENASPLVAR
jgi:carboxylesterase type B